MPTGRARCHCGTIAYIAAVLHSGLEASVECLQLIPFGGAAAPPDTIGLEGSVARLRASGATVAAELGAGDLPISRLERARPSNGRNH